MIDLLFRHLLESTILCILLGCFNRCLRGQAAAVRHSVWLIGIAKFSIPTVLLTTTGAWMAFVLPATAWISSLAAKLSGVLASLFGMLPTHIGADNAPFAVRAFVTIWLLGSAILFGAWLVRLRKSHGGVSIAPNSAQAALDRARRRLSFRAAVELRCSEEGKEPVLAGISRPLIAIPRGLSERLSSDELEAVLLHELAHARRRDNLASAFVHCLVCIFWFHPLVWFVEKQLIAERERACDEMVTESGMSPEIYVAGLIKVCRLHLFGEIAGISAVSGSDLGARFDQILSYRVYKPVPYLVRVVMAGFALSTTILPIAGGYCEQCISNDRGMTRTSPKAKPEAMQMTAHIR